MNTFLSLIAKVKQLPIFQRAAPPQERAWPGHGSIELLSPRELSFIVLKARQVTAANPTSDSMEALASTVRVWLLEQECQPGPVTIVSWT